ncbi:MAG: YeeE/YedE family protein [Fluviibacter sp.]
MTIDWQAFTAQAAIAALLGGFMIGLAAVWLAWTNGRIAGISGIIGHLIELVVQQKREAFGWRIAFLLGLIGAPTLWVLLGTLPAMVQQTGTLGLVIGGVLVGIGTRYANGCTSGHGICGLSRFSLRSLVAVCSFMGSAIVTVFIIRQLGGL